MRSRFLFTLVASLLSAACTRGQDARPRASVPDTLHFPAPSRPTSRIVAPRWTNEDVRDHFGEAARVIALAAVQPGMTVADIGAGDGYYVVRLARIVGAKGKVIGEDIMPDYVDILRARAKYEELTNVEAVLGTPDNPMLALRSIDAAFMIHMYHEITQPYALLWNLSRAMKPAATLAILDQDGPTNAHGTPPALLQCELALFGYEQMKKSILDDGAYVALFRAPAMPVIPDSVRARITNGACKQDK